MDPPVRLRDRLRRAWHPFWLLGVAAPWSWFLLRGLGALAEAVAVVLPLACLVVALLLLIGAALSRRWGPVLVAVSTLVFGVVAVVVPRLPEHGGVPADPIRVVAANIYANNSSQAQAIDTLLMQNADVLVAVETPDAFQSELALRDAQEHPYVASSGSLVLRSRFPVFPLATPPNLPKARVMRVAVNVPGPTLIVYVVHAVNPVFEGSFGLELDFERRLRKDALAETQPVVIVGDLNLSDRTQGYREMNGAFTDAMRSDGRAASTFDGGLYGWLFLRIDHLFVSRTWCGQDPTTFDVPGSDHLGIAASVGVCSPAGTNPLTTSGP